MASVVVLVLAWNGQRFLRACLQALQAQEFSDPWAVLVVDNGSSDGSPGLVRTEFPDVALLTNSTNLGFARGNNVGIRALLSGTVPGIPFVPDVIVLLNQDTEVTPDWLQQLVAPFARDQQIGIVGCKLVFPDGTLQHVGGTVEWPLATGVHHGTGEADMGQGDQETTPDYVAAAATAVHRRVWETIGLFDEGFTPAYYEDTDLCYRARAAGFQIVYTPHAVVMHYENASLQSQSPAHHRAYHRNRIRFVIKYIDPALLPAFADAERDEIRHWSTANSLARKHAYLQGMLTLPSVLAQRADVPDLRTAYQQFNAVLHALHETVVDEERSRRALVADPTTPRADEQPPVEHDTTDGETSTAAEKEVETAVDHVVVVEPSPAPDQGEHLRVNHENAAPPSLPAPQQLHQDQEDTTMRRQDQNGDELITTPQVPPDPVDVAAVMQQIRRRISARQHERTDAEMHAALHQANEQWNRVYEPLNVTPARSLVGSAWRFFSVRLHREVRTYLDPMLFRQSEFNSSMVRALNALARRAPADVSNDVEALRDELMQLRERVRQLEEQMKAQ